MLCRIQTNCKLRAEWAKLMEVFLSLARKDSKVRLTLTCGYTLYAVVAGQR